MARSILSAAAFTIALTGIFAADAKIPAEQVKFFESKIRPVLVEHCYSCHSAETPKGPKAGLRLDTPDGVAKGGASGALATGKSQKKSLLIEALRGTDGVELMPPKGKLKDDAIADFEKWVSMGLPDPREAKGSVAAPKVIDIAEGKKHWAFQPVKRPGIPEATSWATTDVDRFVEAERSKHGLTAAADADARTLVRRVYFDLIGLPPTPEQLDEFLKDKSPKAFEKLVDKLLASPQFGEKWGRHWLDVARYAESSGKDQNMIYPFAWRYRDYVIDSFNRDKPIDQFFREQLAGDLLPHKNDAEKAEHTIATGYLALGTKSHNERNRKQFELDLADEQIDAFSQGMLGITAACARCHDHKFDPIPTKDYYALAGIFLSTETLFGTAAGIQARQSADLAVLPKNAKVSTGPMLSVREVEKLREKLDELKKDYDKQREEDRKAGTPQLRLLALFQQMTTIEKQLSYYEKDGTPKAMAMAAKDRFFPKDSPIHIRGELDETGEKVARGVLQVLSNGTVKIAQGESGRKELADWVASEANPLTARVYVNRVWQHLFGAGLVTSPDNFGTMGQKPSHPELLDFLASTFTKNGWSTKALIKQLVMSRTYRMASDYNSANFGIDPDNVYLWRASKRRLTAEAVRDAMFAASGKLETDRPNGSPIQKYEGNTAILQRFGGLGDVAESKSRSVYLPVIRDMVPESLDLFDFAEPSLVNGKRDDTSVPSQALYMLNNSTVQKLADATASRLHKPLTSDTQKIEQAFRLTLSRSPSQSESSAAEKYIARMRQLEAKTGKKKTDAERTAWGSFVQALFATAEFRYLD